MKTFTFFSFILLASLFLSAQQPYLVQDIFQGDSAVGSLAGFSPQTGDYLYFSAGDPSTTGDELWRTDGTPGGTELVMDIIPGIGSSLPRFFWELNGLIYFTIWDKLQAELWRTDGSREGTYKFLTLGDRNERLGSGIGIMFKDKYFFNGYDEAHGLEFWVTDGTDEGTRLLKDLNPGTDNSWPNHYTLLGNELIFWANDGTGGKIWKSDGTPEGTVIIKDVFLSSLSNSRFFKVGNVLYFAGKDDTHGRELWRTDGTSEGTFMVKDINPGSKDSSPDYFKELNGVVYFAAKEYGVNNELWRSDGTVEGTQLVKDIYSGPKPSNPEFLENLNDQFLLFAANDSIHGSELWITDGTTNGTTLLKDIAPGSASGRPYHMKAFGDMIYFKARDADHGFELWKTDGTEAGTLMVKDMCPGEGSGFDIQFTSNYLTEFNKRLFFAASNGSSGAEPWISDGTAEGTFMLRDIATNQKHSNPESLNDVDGTLYFIAVDTVGFDYDARDLYNTDGTGPGTKRLMKLFKSGQISGIASLGEKVIFSCGFKDIGIKPGITDGTPEGTHLLKDVEGGSGKMVFYKDKVYFYTNSSFWETDGTEEGTKIVMDKIRISDVFPALGQLFLSCPYNTGLWKSDGTREGTQLVTDINGASGIRRFTEFQNKVFFTAVDNTGNQTLWQTDGTETGTQKVADVGPKPDGPDFAYRDVAGEYLFFTINDSEHGWELWKTDGTTGGTAMIKDIVPGEAGSEPGGLVNLNGKLIFFATTPETGKELWISDGSSEGTHIIKDIAPGRFSGVYHEGVQLAKAGDYVYFAGNDGVGDFELWRTDGTETGTIRVSDIFPGEEGSLPMCFQVSGNKLYFSANHPDYGRELWALDVVTGTDEVRLVRALHVYPNPTNNLLTVEGATNKTVYVSDITGRVVRIIAQTESREIIDVSGFPPGMYFIRAGECTAKFLKQ